MSQKSNVKFMALTLLVENYATLSYEYEINNYHSVSIQCRGNLFYFPFAYSPPYYINYGFNGNYRYYFKSEQHNKYFVQAETGYFYLHHKVDNERSESNNFILGPMIGIKKKFKKSKRWFIEASVGSVFIYRNYTEYEYFSGNENEIDPPDNIPSDKDLLRPRFNFEIGVYL